MSDPQNLKEAYVHELQDLWSANDQMKDVVGQMAKSINDDKLSQMFEKSQQGIQKHTDTIKQLIQSAGSETKKEHCRGMEGLVKEAKKHALETKSPDSVKAIAAISQYQRMSHYGIAGFGTCKAYADALGEKEAKVKLDEILEDIYQADDYASELAERSKNEQAMA